MKDMFDFAAPSLRCAFLGTLILTFPDPASAASAALKSVDFNRDIRPILSENCYHCHGPDEHKRKAKLRLDVPEGAYHDLGGYQAIKPKDAKASALWKRITTKNPDDLMPPAESGKKLKPEQIVLLRQWIEQGAKYQGHWAFVSPSQPALPAVAKSYHPRNPIDYFIAAKLESRHLAPSPEAPKETLIRRVTFDLTGLPPTIEEVDEFLADKSTDAYERVVDRLFKSPRYGEHMARFWLDSARYGDTHGLHLDNERSMWPYRDWVIGAFNRNLPFDQFTIEQLAGDLLPNPTQDQVIASGFNRCNVSTSEGGAIPEEFQVRYTVDRTETAATIWLGMTAGCAVCHDHKFDPLSQREFYSLYAFFNNANEHPMDGNALLPPPILKLITPEVKKQLDEFNRQITGLEATLRSEVARIKFEEPPAVTNAPVKPPTELVWVEDEFPAGAKSEFTKDNAPLQWVAADKGKVFSGKQSLKRSAKAVAQDLFSGASQPLTAGEGDKLFAYVYLDPTDLPKAIMLQFHSTGWEHRANWGDEDAIAFGEKNTPKKILAGPLPAAGQWVRLEIDTAKLGITPGTKLDGMAFTQSGGTVYWDKAGLLAANKAVVDPGASQLAWENQQRVKENPPLPKPVSDALKVEVAKRTDQQKQLVRDYYVENVYAAARPTLTPIQNSLSTLRAQRDQVENTRPSTLIMQEMETPRPAFILKRGEYDKPGDPVQRGVPAILPPLAKSNTTNRLDLARWLMDPKHPLTARVTVNRYWQQFYGTGIVKTPGDFGAQGEWPSHPELLDWLATEFMATGWDIKKFHRLLVTSATYRQQSTVTPALLKADPDNRHYARGPRFRLDAEMLRDNALSLSGLLNPKMGGRGVRPYQPPGIWEAVAYTSSNTSKYTQDTGDSLYRRSLYIFWKRTAPSPQMTTFDAPSREACVVRRERTNTPLQALLLMNDPQYFEAARQLGQRMLLQGGPATADRLKFGFRLATARQPNAKEQSVLQQTLDTHLAKYKQDAEAAKKLLAVGESPANATLNPAELAAYTMVANLLLNLDEVVTKN